MCRIPLYIIDHVNFWPPSSRGATKKFGIKCAFLLTQTSVENSYRPVARGYLALGSGYLRPWVGSPGWQPKIAISQLLDVPQQPITTEIGVKLID